MVRYRRNLLPGANYFFTVALLSRASFLLVDHIASLREAFQAVRAQRLFIPGAVVLREHLHCISMLPSGNADYPGAGVRSRPGFHAEFPVANGVVLVAQRRESAGSRVGGMGNTLCPISGIGRGTSLTSISSR